MFVLEEKYLNALDRCSFVCTKYSLRNQCNICSVELVYSSALV